MTWTVYYHPEVEADIDALGKRMALRVKDVIEKRIINGSPDKSGKPLHKELAGCYRIRTGDVRIVYRVNKKEITVLVIAVGLRRNNEVYNITERRLPKKKAAPKKSAPKKRK